MGPLHGSRWLAIKREFRFVKAILLAQTGRVSILMVSP